MKACDLQKAENSSILEELEKKMLNFTKNEVIVEVCLRSYEVKGKDKICYKLIDTVSIVC